MSENDNSDEEDLALAQQIIDDLDVLLPIAEGASSRQNVDSSNPEKLDVSDFGSSPLHPLYSLDPSLRLLTAARNGDIKQVRKIETKITLSLQEFEFDDNIDKSTTSHSQLRYIYTNLYDWSATNYLPPPLHLNKSYRIYPNTFAI